MLILNYTVEIMTVYQQQQQWRMCPFKEMPSNAFTQHFKMYNAQVTLIWVSVINLSCSSEFTQIDI